MEIGIKKVLFDFGIDFKRKNGELIADCPFCGARKKFEANEEKNCYHCWVCDSHGGVKNLVEELGTNWKDYIRNLPNAPIAFTEIKHRKKKRTPHSSYEALNNAYRFLFENCELSESHKQLLLERGLTETEIKQLGYKTYPDEEQISKICKKIEDENRTFDLIPGFYKNSHNKWTLPQLRSGFMIPIRTAGGKIVGVQIRHDDNQTPKYSWLSTNPEKTDKNGKQLYPKGTKAYPYVHWNIRNKRKLGDNNTFVLYLTEGPLKADILAVKRTRNVIAIPGTSSTKDLCSSIKFAYKYIGSLYGKETKLRIVEAFDMDKTTNDNVARNVKKILKTLRDSFDCEVEEFYWDTAMVQDKVLWLGNYKGIDDFIMRNERKKENE